MNLKGERIIIKETKEEGVVMGRDKGLYVVYTNDKDGNLGEVKNLSLAEIEVKIMGGGNG